MISSLKCAVGFVSSSPIMLDRSEPYRGQFSIFEISSSIFSVGRQKANSFTFCTKISSDHRIWTNHCWNRVEWTQQRVPNTYHHSKFCLDKKIEIDKNFQNYFFLINFLRATLKLCLRKYFSAKNIHRNFGFNMEISSNDYS